MFHKVAIANRGTVAARLVRTLRALGLKSVVLYSEADRDLPYVAEADESRLIGPPPAPQSYLNQKAILAAA
ncbi:MAG: biotin carboxylase, partial [Deltaproteobacteria bacterium]|nr:biotin carboxylase [Deltaproteobacteria bacterium]